MKTIKHVLVGFLVLYFVFSLLGTVGLAGEQKQELSDDQEKIMKLWKQYTSPGENHKHLEYFVGQWESIQKIWMQPGSEPIIMTQEISVESLFEGRFTRAHIKNKEEVMGIKIEAFVVTGYDNYNKRFFSVTYGNTGTNCSLMFGTLDKTGKIRKDTGEEDNFFTKKKFKVRAVTTIINEDKYTYESYRIGPGENEVKITEITYSRKK